MGRMDIFCSSPASTAICSGTVVRSSHRPSHHHVLHRHDHDQLRQNKYQHQQPKPRPRDSVSSRYLLSNNDSTSTSSDFVEEHKSKLPPILVRHHDSPKLLDSSPSSCSRHNQVVVLMVSLHCKGCGAKVRKHISKMEGVTSFSIDLETKKVTVTGNVTPSSVLDSVSRVKNAQFWPLS